MIIKKGHSCLAKSFSALWRGGGTPVNTPDEITDLEVKGDLGGDI